MLSYEDRLAIARLYDRFWWARDSFNAQALANTFTEDGVLSLDGVEHAGRQAILRYYEEANAARANSPYEAVQHVMNNLVLDGDAESARGQSYYSVMGRTKNGNDFKIYSMGWL